MGQGTGGTNKAPREAVGMENVATFQRKKMCKVPEKGDTASAVAVHCGGVETAYGLGKRGDDPALPSCSDLIGASTTQTGFSRYMGEALRSSRRATFGEGRNQGYHIALPT